jgi:hypothetical protein
MCAIPINNYQFIETNFIHEEKKEETQTRKTKKIPQL